MIVHANHTITDNYRSDRSQFHLPDMSLPVLVDHNHLPLSLGLELVSLPDMSLPVLVQGVYLIQCLSARGPCSRIRRPDD
jgi:hypothetical protein